MYSQSSLVSQFPFQRGNRGPVDFKQPWHIVSQYICVHVAWFNSACLIATRSDREGDCSRKVHSIHEQVTRVNSRRRVQSFVSFDLASLDEGTAVNCIKSRGRAFHAAGKRRYLLERLTPGRRAASRRLASRRFTEHFAIKRGEI